MTAARRALNAVFPDWAEAAPALAALQLLDQIAVRSGTVPALQEGDGVAILHLDIRRGAAQTPALTPYAMGGAPRRRGLAAIEADPRHPKSKARKGG